jgi:hypothetical protein
MGSTLGKTINKKQQIKNYVSWFEIPAVNFDKAVSFYNSIYGIEMKTFKNSEQSMAFFPSLGEVGGSIVCGSGSIPSKGGPLLYLNGGDDLNTILGKIPAAGGRIIMPKTFIDEESGYFAIFIDTEGNKLALHSKK